jgi:hypothetical protein|tara:strand:+ start:5032 stop:5919 length:888 start_codon:yes stop_codon:yes gene_type:complete
MGYTKPKETTKWHLENATLPNHGKTYTVVSHKSVIDNTLQLLKDSGFTVQREIYRANMNANVAQGIYHIYPTQTTDQQIVTENELGMMFAWTNSYDKSTRFQCAVGAYVMVCYNGMIAGDMMNFKRKHTGSADYDVKVHLADQIKNAEKYYKRILQDKNAMKTIKLDCAEQSELIGRLFIEEDLLDSQQMSCIKSEMNKSSYDYGTDDNSAWTFYNHVTHALKKAHPRDWLSDQQNFHDFITAECLSNNSLNLNNFELNTDNTDLGITMKDNEVAIEIDEDISHAMLVQDVYMGR